MAIERRYCLTGGSRLGLVPRHAKEGDKTVISHGSKVPTVICKASSEDNTYTIIGECYINGIKYGEALKWEGCQAGMIALV